MAPIIVVDVVGDIRCIGIRCHAAIHGERPQTEAGVISFELSLWTGRKLCKKQGMRLND